jgi:hypothetical protein
MERIRLIKNYEVNGSSFVIETSLSTGSQSITTLVKYDGIVKMQINADYINSKELTDHYNEVYEICDSIAERRSGWKNVIDILLQDGFDLVYHSKT